MKVENALQTLETNQVCSASSFYAELTQHNLDEHLYEFINLLRNIPDVGMRNFENAHANSPMEVAKLQSRFALYVLGRLMPSYDLWHKETRWEVNEPN